MEDRVEQNCLRKPSTESRPITIPFHNDPPSSSPNRVSHSHVHLYGTMIGRQLSQHRHLNPGSNTLDNYIVQYVSSCTSSARIVSQLSRFVGSKVVVVKVPVKHSPGRRSQATILSGCLQFRLAFRTGVLGSLYTVTKMTPP